MDTGIGDHDVQPAELPDPLVDRGLHLVERRHIGHTGVAALAALLHRGGDIGQIRCGTGDIESDDVGTLVGEPLAVDPAGTAGGTGDEHDLVQ